MYTNTILFTFNLSQTNTSCVSLRPDKHVELILIMTKLSSRLISYFNVVKPATFTLASCVTFLSYTGTWPPFLKDCNHSVYLYETVTTSCFW